MTVSDTDSLRDRQAVNVTWSGAHPTGGIFADVNSGAAAQEEYPVVLLQCRGVDSDTAPADQRLSQQTCWTSTPLERFQASDFIFPPYRVDRYSSAGRPHPQPRPAGPGARPTARRSSAAARATGSRSSRPTARCTAAVAATVAPASRRRRPSRTARSRATRRTGSADSAGDGSAKFVIQNADTNASLGCSDQVKCSLVIVPIMGISCDTAAAALPPDDQPGTFNVADQAFALCSQTGAFAPGLANPGSVNQEDLAVAGALWWSGSNWRNRISVPLTFAQSASVCSVLNNSAPVYVYGSESMTQASLQWAPKFCLDSSLFKFQHVQTGEPQAKNLLQSGSVEAAFQASPPVTPFTRPVAQAPVAVTGFVIATDIDDATGHSLTDVKLTPRLLAKLLTESYPSNPSVRSEYPKDKKGNDTLGGNPWNMATDPEFLALNPTADRLPLAAEPAAALMSLASDSDLIWSLTSYINADPDARAFLDGTPDPWGMVVNPQYKGIALPTNSWPLLDTFEPKSLYAQTNRCLNDSPVPWLPLVASPVSAMSTITLDLQFNIANSQIRCANEGQQNQKLTALGREVPGTRFILGLTSLADAERYQLDAAQLLTHTSAGAATKFTNADGRTFVGPSSDSLRAAVGLLKPDRTTNTWPVPYATLRTSADGEQAYPGTLVMSMDVPVAGLPKADAARYATLLRFAVGAGQVAGVGNGQLPPGFLPMTADNGLDALVAYSRRAATAVAAQTGDLPYVTGGSTGPTATATSPPPLATGGTTSGASTPPASTPPASTTPSTSGTPSPGGSPVVAPVSLGTTRNIASGSLGLVLPAVLALAVLACAGVLADRVLRPEAGRPMTAVDTSERPTDVELDGAQEPPPGRFRQVLDRVLRIGRGRHGRRPSSRPPLSPVASGLRWSLACLALIGVWVLLYAFVLSGVQEARAQATYYATLRQGLAEATAPIGGVIQPGSPVLLLTAPTAGLDDAVVVEGTTSSAMTSGPGHLASTVLPGQQGVSVILGRSVTFGAPFRSIATMHPGDTITVTTGQGVFTYHVDRVRYPGDPLPPPVGPNTSRLTLVTEIASGWRSGWAPATTVYVDATMQGGQIQPAPLDGSPASPSTPSRWPATRAPW